MAGLESLQTRFGAVVEYDGTAYQGFQRQLPEQPTIQGALERALGQIAGHSVTIIGAGRTDSGVHARGQVVSFLLAWRHESAALQRALNANLPLDIAVLKLLKAPSAFHPRYDARRRNYEYVIYNQAVRSPLKRHRSWHVKTPLAIAKMNEAAACLVGRHDFATFGRAPQGNNTVRELFQADWQRRGKQLLFRVSANAFLYRMVRSLVGSLRRVGDGSWQVSEFQEAFAACERERAGGLAPPQGLFLKSVEYDEEWISPS